ncbi:hypothetical protein NUSPORA_00029 [Nucleospora cyclopteri]
MIFLKYMNLVKTDLTNSCSQLCRKDFTTDCPEYCLTYGALLKGAGLPMGDMINQINKKDNSGLSPADLAEKIRKTYENALDNVNLIDSNAISSAISNPNAMLTPNSADTSGKVPQKPFNPIKPNSKTPLLDQNGNLTSDPLGGGPGNPLFRNKGNRFTNTNPYHPDYSKNTPINPMNPMNPSGNPLNPDIPTVRDLLPPKPSVGSNPPISQIPYVPTSNVKTVPSRITLYSYIPQATTIYVTSPPIMIKQKASTITYSLPNKTITQNAPPQFIELPPTTIIQTVNAPPVTVTPPTIYSTLPATTKTFIQPVEMPPETLVSYAPQEIVTAPGTTMLLTKTIQLPPCVVTKSFPPVTKTLPATTVVVYRTKAYPPQTMILEKVRYFPAYSTIIKTIKDTIVPLNEVRTVTLPNSNIIFTKDQNGVVRGIPINVQIPPASNMNPTPGIENKKPDLNDGNGILTFLSGLVSGVFGPENTQTKNMPIFDTKRLKTFCNANEFNKKMSICSFIKNTNCSLPKIYQCFSSMLNNNYTYQPQTEECGPLSPKACLIHTEGFNPNDTEKEPAKTEKIEPIRSDSQTGFEKKMKKLMNFNPKSSLKTDIGNAYNESKDKIVYLSDIMKSD